MPRDRWPQLDSVQIRDRAGFAHLDGGLPVGSPDEALDAARY
jgi:hypothetical protein